MHEITAGHRSLSGTISCVTDRIRFLPVTMTDRFSNFNSITYTEDQHEMRVTGTMCRQPDTMSGTSEIFISGPEQVCQFTGMQPSRREKLQKWDSGGALNLLLISEHLKGIDQVILSTYQPISGR